MRGAKSGARLEVHPKVERQLQLSRQTWQRPVPYLTVPVQDFGVVVIAALCTRQTLGASRVPGNRISRRAVAGG